MVEKLFKEKKKIFNVYFQFYLILESNYEKNTNYFFFQELMRFYIEKGKTKHVFLHNSFQYFDYILYWIGLNNFLKLSFKLILFHCEDIY